MKRRVIPSRPASLTGSKPTRRRVGFDASCLRSERPTGVELSFCRTLAAFVRSADVECVAFAPVRAADQLPDDCTLVPIPDAVPSSVWRRFVLPRLLRSRGIDVLWSPTTAMPPRGTEATRRVATVHELPSRRAGADVAPLRSLRDELARERLASRADLVVVPSSRSADDLLRERPELDGRIRVLNQPLGTAYLEAGSAAQPAAASRPSGAVFVGADRRRKNLARLVHAHRELPEGLRAAHPLRWVGGPVDASLHALPRLSDAELVDCVRGSRGVALPSLSEGFGLPALEALAVGRPALGARDSVTTDLCGDLCVAVDPYDVASIRAGLERMFRDDELLERAEREGPRRVRELSAESSAAGWIAILEELAS